MTLAQLILFFHFQGRSPSGLKNKLPHSTWGSLWVVAIVFLAKRWEEGGVSSSVCLYSPVNPRRVVSAVVFDFSSIRLLGGGL